MVGQRQKQLLMERKLLAAQAALHAVLLQYADDSDEQRIEVILKRLRKKAREQQFKLPTHSIFGKGVVCTEPVINEAKLRLLRGLRVIR